MGFIASNALSAIADVHTRNSLKALGLEFDKLEKSVSTLIRNNRAVVSYTPTTVTITAGAGLTGGGDLTTNRTISLSSAFGLTVTADDTSVDQGMVPTWTGIHTFSAQDVHNAGISLGTSGTFNSQVANAAAAASFKWQPAIAQTAGTDRYNYRFNNQAGTSNMTIFANGQVEWNGLAGSNTGFLQVAGTIPTGPYLGINFAPQAFSSTGTIAGVTTCTGGALFQTISGSGASSIAGMFSVQGDGTSTQPLVYAAAFQSSYIGGVGKVVTDLGCIYLRDASTSSKGTVTTWRGIWGSSNPSGFPAAANRYWIDLAEITTGSGVRTSINCQSATAGYKCITLGDANTWLAWESAAVGSLNATTWKMKCDVDISAKNIVTDTSTGTKIGTGTTQKIGFYNTTPIGQYATTGTATGYTGGGGTALTHTDTFTGNTGSTAYTIGDIVRALKLWGAIAA